MIVPLIECTPPSDSERNQQWQSALIERCHYWRLFGAVAIKTNGIPIELLLPVVRCVGGWADLELEVPVQQSDQTVELLNAGATAITCRTDDYPEFESRLPSDRLRVLTDDPEVKSGRLRLTEPKPTTLTECFRDRRPVQVPVDWLESNTDTWGNSLADSLESDRPDGLWPTLVVDPLNTALGLTYSNRESLLASIQTRQATYWSRSRNELWVKGKTSGATQQLLSIRTDCDSDCLRFQVRQQPPGFCHLETSTCFGEERTIQSVCDRLLDRIHGADEKSFTQKLANDPAMLKTKLLEEAGELADATERADVVWEAADVLYFSLVKMVCEGVRLEEVFAELAGRMNRVVRRKNKLEE